MKVGKARDYEMDFPPTHADCVALAYMSLRSAEGWGRLMFVCYNLALLLLWLVHELQHPLDEKPKGF